MNPQLYRPTYAEVSLSALVANWQALRGIADFASPQSMTTQSSTTPFFCPMVKADAYGHGDIKIAHCLVENGAQTLGVCLIEEALRLRQNNIKVPILFFDPFSKHAVDTIEEYDLTPVVSDWEQLEILAGMNRVKRRPILIHLKFNSGMNRLGFETDQAVHVKARLSDLPHIQVVGLCTHFLAGEDFKEKKSHSLRQLQLFTQVCEIFSDLTSITHTHVFNSIGLLSFSQHLKSETFIGDERIKKYGCRPGLGIYGLLPKSMNDEFKLQAVLSLHSQIVQLHRIRKNDLVSYGGTWRAEKDSVIAVVPVGYGDGYCRLLSNRGSVLLRGQRAPVIGRVCMDFIMIDVTHLNLMGEIQLGEKLVLLGSQNSQSISATEIAELTGTIEYEVLTRLSHRIPRIYQNP